ncbi:calpastatin [Methylobacterium sp. Leaf94]|nr:calpastatin [Methylobacterium sp. Leaf94]
MPRAQRPTTRPNKLVFSALASLWVWFIFPQVAGLGFSAMAQRYAISGLDEAQAYLQHPVLGERLRVCTAAVNAVTGRTAHQVFGSPDDMKFRSSMTLFGRAAPDEPAFRVALERYFGGQEDPHTLEILQTR